MGPPFGSHFAVTPGLDPGVHVFEFIRKVVDGRVKPGQDGEVANFSMPMLPHFHFCVPLGPKAC